MNKTEQINELAKALSTAQVEMNGAYKDSKNPFFKSNYADLKQVMQVFQSYYAPKGLAVTQLVGLGEIETVLMHSSGQFISTICALPVVKQNDPQALGSSVSYMRRYALSAILGIYQTDDDGEAAMDRDSYRTMSPTHQPIAPKIEIKPTKESIATQPSTDTENVFKIGFGKFKGKSLEEVGKKDVEGYRDYLIDQSKLKEVPLTAVLQDFVDRANVYLQS